ncbi:hypothetical protein [Polynucleobacter cosmopolitanus]|jgi:hypothetical protein|uniref:Uncharacterized protein n=1 Tax=Polynucleobacter cosmopolitanus TaxID=351345 RepID=A0A229FW90_9BURK|nr:hypothetical protein [Polynucleobacter cosmopolitanus]OXL16277.1 hypothetical protein AOC33_04175 [Polynucleobacter cosmopolitanus]
MEYTVEKLKNLESFKDFLDSPEGHRLFKNKYSGDWFIRTHAQELIAAGVLVKLMGRFHIVQPDFVPTLIELLQEKTKRSFSVKH